MRVICIESTVWAYSKKPEEIGTISVQKGSIYHVVSSIDATELRKIEKFQNVGDGIWYQLLELDGWHHSMRFLEIPSDDLSTQVSSEVLKEKSL